MSRSCSKRRFPIPRAISRLWARARHLGVFGSPKERDYEIVREYFSILGITGLEERNFNALSGGQRQLVMIAQALSSQCDLLILDEPCAALDYKNQDTVLDLLAKLRDSHGMTIIFSTHMPQHAVEVASHVLLMAAPGQYRIGPAEEVLNAENLSDLYGLPIGRAEIAGHPRHSFAPLFRARETSDHV